MVHVDLNRLALDFIGESAFGYQFKTVLGGETDVTKAFSHLTTGVRFGSFALALPFYKYLPTKENRLMWKAAKITNEVVMKVLNGRASELAGAEYFPVRSYITLSILSY